jgi:NAD(P)-dependent dehydrogenase (short-subunit alcohol dehydrogenase family)
VLDISCHSSILSFVKEFKALKKPLNLLVNNAGIYQESFVPIKGLESQFVTNYLGPFVLTEFLIDLMPEHSRIIQVGSVAQYNIKRICPAAINDPKLFESDGGYSLSKALVALSSVHFTKKYSSKNIHVITVHPGGVATQIFRSVPWLSWVILNFAVRLGLALNPMQGAMSILWLALCVTDDQIKEYDASYVSEMKRRSLPLDLGSDPMDKKIQDRLSSDLQIVETMTRFAWKESGWANE